MRAIGYTRVSTEEQGDSRAGLEAQEAAIRAEVKHRGWELKEMMFDVASGGSLRKRDELGRALRMLAAKDADILVVAKLDRLSRSVLDFAGIMESANREGWAVAVLDLGVDTSTTNGKLIMHVMIALAQWEREIIGDRTKNALTAVRARGTKLGRPSRVGEDTRKLIRSLRGAGLSWKKVADSLTAQGIPTGQGGEWHASTVRRIYLTDPASENSSHQGLA